MCIGGASVSAAAPTPAPPPSAPIASNPDVQGASASQMLQARAAAGLASTILTPPTGALATPNAGAGKTLLGA